MCLLNPGIGSTMNTSKKIIFSLILLFCSVPVLAADCTSALKIYMTGDAHKAIKVFQKLAKKGDGCAQFQLGMMYFFGHGTDKNEKQARKWVNKSVKAGFGKAKEAVTHWEAMKVKSDRTSGRG